MLGGRITAFDLILLILLISRCEQLPKLGDLMLIITTRSKVASEVDDDMFDNWGDDGFGDNDFGDFGEDEGPEVSVAKCHRYTFV